MTLRNLLAPIPASVSSGVFWVWLWEVIGKYFYASLGPEWLDVNPTSKLNGPPRTSLWLQTLSCVCLPDYRNSVAHRIDLDNRPEC